MPAFSLTTLMAIANMVLRGLHEAPDLVDAFEAFWQKVVGNPEAPPHIIAAVTAAIAEVRNPKLV